MFFLPPCGTRGPSKRAAPAVEAEEHQPYSKGELKVVYNLWSRTGPGREGSCWGKMVVDWVIQTWVTHRRCQGHMGFPCFWNVPSFPVACCCVLWNAANNKQNETKSPSASEQTNPESVRHGKWIRNRKLHVTYLRSNMNERGCISHYFKGSIRGALQSMKEGLLLRLDVS